MALIGKVARRFATRSSAMPAAAVHAYSSALRRGAAPATRAIRVREARPVASRIRGLPSIEEVLERETVDGF